MFRTTLSLLCASVICLASQTARATEQTDYLPLDDLKYVIQLAIREAMQTNVSEPFFLVERVELELNIRKDVEKGVSLGLPIFSADFDLGTSTLETAVEHIELTLTVSEELPTRGAPRISFTHVLRQIRDTFAKDAPRPGSPGLPTLVVEALTYSRQWTIRRGKGGDVHILIVRAGGSIKKEFIQSVTFHLCRTVNRRNCVPR